jgi:hypothetical protein
MTRATHSDQSNHRAWPVVFIAAMTGLLCLLVASSLAYHHPLSPLWATLGVASLAVLGAWQARSVWWLPPALLPLIGLAPWTGWIVFEEFDLLLLALMAGGYARLAFSTPMVAVGPNDAGRKSRRHRRPQGAYALVALTVLLFAASVVIAMFRGFDDAGGFSFGWFQGYHEPMNSLRLAKPFFLALLWWPLWQAAQRTSPDDAPQALGLGFSLGMATVGLVALWERLAFTGLLNFSTDYRTTALFWEMHVGGAALDGFLALTVPFVLRELMQARSGSRWMLAAGVMLLAAYVSLTTFSRGVYLALPLGLGFTAWLQTRQIHRRSHLHGGDVSVGYGGEVRPSAPRPQGEPSWRTSLCWVVLFMVAAAWMFPTSGYRGMLALLGSLGLLMLLLPRLRPLGAAHWIIAFIAAALLATCAWGMAWLVPKGAYIAYALLATGTAVVVAGGWLKPSTSPSVRSNIVGASGLLATWATMVAVAMHWGGEAAAKQAGVVAISLAALLPALLRFWRRSKSTASSSNPSWRNQLAAIGAMAISGALVAVFAGGAYMGGRFSTGGKDFGGRLMHWEIGMNALSGPWDWALGKGLGRFPSNHFNSGLVEDQTGDYRLLQDSDGNRHLVLSGGKHIIGWGEMLRVSQRVAAPQGTTRVQFDTRVKTPLTLHVEVCEKHLLYNNACLIKQVEVKPVAGGAPTWQRVSAILDGERNPSTGLIWAPKLIMFSVGVYTNGAVAEVDNLVLMDGTGDNLLRNGDFARELSQWFFTSDRHHMPWHIKSMFMHVFFDQGLVGLLLWLALSAGALWRVTLGNARHHSLSPAIAGSLLGFAVVGLFDSLLDVPRLATLYYLLVLVALVLRPPNPHNGASQ